MSDSLVERFVSNAFVDGFVERLLSDSLVERFVSNGFVDGFVERLLSDGLDRQEISLCILLNKNVLRTIS